MSLRGRDKIASSKSPTSLAPVVVGIDDSPTSRLALGWAIDEAVRRASPLELIHVWRPAPPAQPDRFGYAVPSRPVRPHAESVLATSIGRARAAAPSLEIEGVLIRGVASKVLLESASRALLLVIGSRGLGEIRGRLLHSVGLHTISQANCPVVVVGAEAHVDGPVIAAVDGSRSSRGILAQAIEEARLRRCQVRIIWALHSRSDAASRDGKIAGLSAHVEIMITAMLAELSPNSADLHVDACFPVGPAAQTLVAASAGSQLVVIGSRGAGLAGMRLGSVSHEVAAHGRCPVMVMPVLASS